MPWRKAFNLKIGIEYNKMKLHTLSIKRQKEKTYNYYREMFNERLYMSNSLYEILHRNV